MTHYDKLIDSIIDEMYYLWKETWEWDDAASKETAHRILQHVEEFQSNRILPTTDTSVYTQWRASD